MAACRPTAAATAAATAALPHGLRMRGTHEDLLRERPPSNMRAAPLPPPPAPPRPSLPCAAQSTQAPPARCVSWLYSGYWRSPWRHLPPLAARAGALSLLAARDGAPPPLLQARTAQTPLHSTTRLPELPAGGPPRYRKEHRLQTLPGMEAHCLRHRRPATRQPQRTPEQDSLSAFLPPSPAH